MNKNFTAYQLADWLQHIAAVHPREIELGLGRIRQVADRLSLSKPAPLTITVAGTNGKGSSVRLLESILEAAGYSTGAYTSPHLLRFNERIRIDSQDVSDAELCRAFTAIETVRKGVSLTYFEYATLAALLLFEEAKVDIAVLEVGLGGRLDAVNLIDADLVIITNIGLDHLDWLGTDVESIAAEKAGVMRQNQPVIYGAQPLPSSIRRIAGQLECTTWVAGHDYSYQVKGRDYWQWQGKGLEGRAVELGNLPLPHYVLANAAAVIQALQILPLKVSRESLSRGLTDSSLAGRCQHKFDPLRGRQILFDVAHNPEAAVQLADYLKRTQQDDSAGQQLIVVLAVMADKDIEGIVSNLESLAHIWYISQVDEPRRMDANEAAVRVKEMCPGSTVRCYEQIEDAYHGACQEADENTLIVVTGSFYTVAAIQAKYVLEPVQKSV